MRERVLTDSEAGPRAATCGVGRQLAVIQRGHVPALAEVGAAPLAAAHLAHGRREEHLDALRSSSSSYSSWLDGGLSAGWRQGEDGEGEQS